MSYFIKDTKESNVIDISDKTSNMYGCQPCPKCKSEYRYVIVKEPDLIRCDHCGYKEKIKEIKNS